MEAVDMALANSHQLKAGSCKNRPTICRTQRIRRKKITQCISICIVSATRQRQCWLQNKVQWLQWTRWRFPSVNSAVYGLLNASLPIYAGGRIKYGIEAARILADAAKLDSTHQRQDIIMNTVESYVNLCKARAALKLMNQNLEDAKQRVTDLANLEKKWNTSVKNDFVQSRITTK